MFPQADSNSISWFMKRLESPSVIEASKENIDSIKMNGDLAVIAFVDDLDTEAESVFLSTAESFHGIHAFGISRSRDLAASEHAPYPSVMVYNRDSDSATRFPDSMTFTEQTYTSSWKLRIIRSLRKSISTPSIVIKRYASSLIR
jgi:hypothetical protein